MSDHSISQIRPTDRRGLAQIDALLAQEGIRRDANLDYICGMYDEDYRIIATGSCFGNTLRCFAVDSRYQGEGLLNEILTHLIEVQYSRGNTRLFLYTKIDTAKFFGDLGFYEIARVDGSLVFMENRKNGFADYLAGLAAESRRADAATAGPAAGVTATGAIADAATAGTAADAVTADAATAGPAAGVTATGAIADAATAGTAADAVTANAADGAPRSGPVPAPHARVGAVVMNANPFTLGHQYLVEKAASECDLLHLFIVSEDSSLVPFAVRRRLVLDGTAHLPNVICHDSGPYIISSSTFPSYFLKDEAAVIEGHARLDLAVFVKIAAALGIQARYVGVEHASQVTGIYNQIMSSELPKAGIECIVIPRKEVDGRPISASQVRQYLQKREFEPLKALVPDTTLAYLMSPEAEPVIQRICEAGNVVHY